MIPDQQDGAFFIKNTPGNIRVIIAREFAVDRQVISYGERADRLKHPGMNCHRSRVLVALLIGQLRGVQYVLNEDSDLRET